MEEKPIPSKESEFKPLIKFLSLNRNTTLIAVGGITLSVVVISLGFFLFSAKSPEAPKSKSNQINQQEISVNNTNNAPVVKFQNYANNAKLPTNPGDLKVYTLKSDFTPDEVSEFAKKFNLTEKSNTDNYNPIFYSRVKGFEGLLRFNTTTGSFYYEAWSILKSKTPGSDAKITASNFIKEIGLFDDTLVCDITYKNKALQDVTFVECHRMPDKLTATLINPSGILNLPEETPLSSLRVGYNPPNMPKNEAIQNVSTGQNQQSRPNDFNTITVGVLKDGSIVSIDSNIRWIKAEKVVPSNKIITPEKALVEFKANKAQLSLTLPAGSGVANWDEVYPKNQAIGKDATVTDIALIYTENPSYNRQLEYTPQYLIRGTSKLDSGYTVRFIQLLPAIDNQVLAARASSNPDTLQLEPYYPPVPSSQGWAGFSCDSTRQIAKEFTIQVPGYGQIEVASYENAPNTFFVKKPFANVDEMDKFRKELFNEYNKNPSSYRDTPLGVWLQSIIDQVNNVGAWSYFSPGSNCYITGISPSLFLYSQPQSGVDITPAPFTTYMDPPSINGSWKLPLIHKRDSLYYEYDPNKTDFSSQKSGFIVNKNNWEKTIEEISNRLQLTSPEQNSLKIDISRSIQKIKSDRIVLSIIEQTEVNQKLPITITPTPDNLHRIIILITPTDHNTLIPQQSLSPIIRNGFTIVEVGIAIKNR